MSKMRYFSNKFSKISKRWRFSAASNAPNLRCLWPDVA